MPPSTILYLTLVAAVLAASAAAQSPERSPWLALPPTPMRQALKPQSPVSDPATPPTPPPMPTSTPPSPPEKDDDSAAPAASPSSPTSEPPSDAPAPQTDAAASTFGLATARTVAVWTVIAFCVLAM